MKFGKVDHPEKIDFTLPEDHPDTAKILKNFKGPERKFEVYVGCAKWNKRDLKGFYPRGTKDELSYYSTQFNSIELNATFYKSPDKNQVETWASKTPDNFRFFPKIPQTVSHYKRLNEVKRPLEEFCYAISHFAEKLGMVFLQMPNNFHPKFLNRVQHVIGNFPDGIPLALEMRHKDWFRESEVFDKFYHILKETGRTNIIVDTAGRRDLLHMRLSSDAAFIRYVGSNAPSDYSRLEDWVNRIGIWHANGLRKLYFFLHQNIEKESPLLSAHFIEKLNSKLKLSLKVPETQGKS